MNQLNIAILVGSLRRGSFDAQLARAVVKLAPADFGMASLTF